MLDKIKGAFGALNITWVTFGKWATLFIIVAACVAGYTYLIFNAGKDSREKEIQAVSQDFKKYREMVDDNTRETANIATVLEEAYTGELSRMETDYEQQIEKLNTLISDYQRNRLRDKNTIRTAENRISSLSEAAERLAGADERAGILSEKLERLENGILGRLVEPAEGDLAKLRLCGQYITALRKLKDKYDALRLEYPIPVYDIE